MFRLEHVSFGNPHRGFVAHYHAAETGFRHIGFRDDDGRYLQPARSAWRTKRRAEADCA